MYVSKKSREYPSEFTVSDPASKSWVGFHGVDAKALADEYAAFKNAPAAKERKAE